MSEHTKQYTVEGMKDGERVSKTFRAFGQRDARKTAKKLWGIEPLVVRDWYGEVWHAPNIDKQTED